MGSLYSSQPTKGRHGKTTCGTGFISLLRASYVMGKFTNAQQDVKTVLQSFGSKIMSARRRYREFVSQGIEQGKRSELIGGGLVRSMGGWEEVKKLQKDRVPIKGDERILGNSAFVNQILSEAEEYFERFHYLGHEWGCP